MGDYMDGFTYKFNNYNKDIIMVFTCNLEKVDTTGWSFDDYKSWASNRGGFSEDCGIDYDCGGSGPCVVMDIPYEHAITVGRVMPGNP